MTISILTLINQNYMKYSIQYLILLLLFVFATNGCEQDKFEDFQDHIATQYDYPPLFSAQNNYVVDLYLVYQGTSSTIAYRREHFIPYVYSEQDNEFNWTFDGFLFLELQTESGRNFGSSAIKSDWDWLIDRQLKTSDVGVPALNTLLDSLHSVGKEPIRKRKVVISIPSPSSSDIDWGEIDGKQMDMTHDADRIKCVKWYIDKVMDEWRNCDFSELEFSGFYWLHEGETNYTTDRFILPEISRYIKSLGFHFYWIPYFGAHMGADWKQWGFDIAYQQPNYFFRHEDEEWPATRLDDACQFASKYNMGLEMEIDASIKDPMFQTRFLEYLEFFDKNKVLETAPMAHYDGRGTIYEMSVSKDTTLRNLYQTYMDAVVARQKYADQLIMQIVQQD